MENDGQTTADKGNGGGSAMAGGVITQDGRGRFRGTAELTDKQRLFVEAYLANGAKRKLAAISAGYTNPETEGWRMMKNPAVLQAIREGREELISGEMSGIAMGTLKQIMLDTAAPPAARVAAAKWTLEAAGHGIAAQALKQRGGLDLTDKNLSDMSLAEIEELVAAQLAKVDALRPLSARSVDVQASVVSAA